MNSRKVVVIVLFVGHFMFCVSNVKKHFLLC